MTCNTPPDLIPLSQTSRVTLPRTGSYANVASSLQIGVYAASPEFITGAVDQVSYTFKMLGGDVVDIELTDCNVYAAYESAVLEYSYIVNLYQAKNALSSFLGTTTSSFNADGQIVSGSAMSGSNAALKYPRFTIGYSRRISDEIAYEAGIGGTVPYFSASIDIIPDTADYDLQNIVSASAAAGGQAYSNLVNGSAGARIRVNRVWYKSPLNFWRFFGAYGGLSVVGNLSTYGQYADDTTYEVVPAWQNILQASAFETNLYTRASHYTFELKNNKVRFFPVPTSIAPKKIWFEFSIDPSPLDEYEDVNGNSLGGVSGVNGVNNINNLPFENIPYESINSLGKQWTRRFALAVAKSMLAQIRGKFTTLPIPGESVTLNHAELSSQAKEEMDKLREELKTQLEATTYDKLAEREASMVEMAAKVQQYIPRAIWFA